MLSFKPHTITAKLMKVVNGRTRDVLERRYGIGDSSETSTLESIGRSYGITRERVRQIEGHGIHVMQRSPIYTELTDIFDELHTLIQQHGIILDEDTLLDIVAPKTPGRNHVLFLLTVGTRFHRMKENPLYRTRWHVDPKIAQSIEGMLDKLFNGLQQDQLLTEQEMHNRVRNELPQLEAHHTPEIMARWLSLSKRLGQNPLGEWGSADSSNVRTKGVRDYAYLVVKRHGSPMHFREVAEAIEQTFDRPVHVATTHNELIKDKRFVLVGRGLYALSEWGYTQGVVKDVIQAVLRRHGELTRDEVIDFVRKERYVKDNTILVNLQDTALFKKIANGKYIALD